MLSLIDDAVIDAIIDALRDEDIDALKRLINILNDQFLDARGCLDQILYSLRDRMIASVQDTHFARYRTLFYGFRDAYTSVRIVSDGMLLLEMTFWSLI